MRIVVVDPNSLAGFFSHFFRVISCLRASDEKGIPLAIDWSNLHNYQDLHYGRNVWEYYFHQPFDISVAEAQKLNPHCAVDFEYGYMYTFENGQKLLSLTRSLMQKYIRIHPEILEECQRLKNDLGITSKTLGVKRRGTDMARHHGVKLSNEDFFPAVDLQIDQFTNIFLCSDEQMTIDAFQRRYGKRVMCVPNVIRSTTDVPIHNVLTLGSGFKKGLDVILDALLLSKCGLMLITCSGVSYFSICHQLQPNFVYIDEHLTYHG